MGWLLNVALMVRATLATVPVPDPRAGTQGRAVESALLALSTRHTEPTVAGRCRGAGAALGQQVAALIGQRGGWSDGAVVAVVVPRVARPTVRCIAVPLMALACAHAEATV